MSNGGNEDEATNEAEETSERLDREMKGYIENAKIFLVIFGIVIIFILIFILANGAA